MQSTAPQHRDSVDLEFYRNAFFVVSGSKTADPQCFLIAPEAKKLTPRRSFCKKAADFVMTETEKELLYAGASLLARLKNRRYGMFLPIIFTGNSIFPRFQSLFPSMKPRQTVS